ncbi:MAG: hypothetical protein ACPL3B_08650, partial [Fervidobacterium sp.]
TLDFTFGMIFSSIMDAYKSTECSAYLPIIERGSTDFEDVPVNDYLIVQYVTPAEALERLVSGALPDMLGEFKLDFTSSAPTLNIVQFDPSSGYYGVGSDKSATFKIVEGQNAKLMDIRFDYEAMGNSIVISGAKFYGSDIIEAELVRDDNSILQYGFKQITKPVGSCVSVPEIRRYINNLLPLLSKPIPSINVRFFKDTFLKTQMIYPGDVINLYGDSLSNIFGTSSITARVRTLDIRYSPSEGEEISCTLSYPVEKGPQFISGFATPSIQTLLGGLKREVKDALYTTYGGTYEYLPISHSFELKDTTLKMFSILPVDMTASIEKYDGVKSVDLLIKTVKLTVNGTTNVEPKVNATVIAPDGSIVFKNDILLGGKYDITLCFSPVINSSYNLLTQYIGKYLIMFKNTSSNTYGKFTALVEIGFIRDVTKTYKAV